MYCITVTGATFSYTERRRSGKDAIENMFTPREIRNARHIRQDLPLNGSEVLGKYALQRLDSYISLSSRQRQYVFAGAYSIGKYVDTTQPTR